MQAAPRPGPRRWQGHPSLSRPLTILGVERAAFIVLLTLCYAFGNLGGGWVGALALFVPLFAAGRWMAAADPCMLAVIRANAAARAHYDPAPLPKAERTVL